MEQNQNNGALQGNQAEAAPAVYFAGLDSAMADFPVQPELFSSAGEWFMACRKAMIDIPAQLGHALSQVEKELGLGWPDSLYLLRQNHYIEIWPPFVLSIRLNWNRLIADYREWLKAVKDHKKNIGGTGFGQQPGKKIPKAPGEYHGGNDSEMALIPVRPDSFSSVVDWFEACIAARMVVPIRVGLSVIRVEKELGLGWPESFYFLRFHQYIIITPDGLDTQEEIDLNRLIAENKK